ncbi:MAG TPA: hypothetical protein VEP90_16010, partial [Methylomirabilota bacterium]|nr:hypothetical protein [Methylomirabilota bacterium]
MINRRTGVDHFVADAEFFDRFQSKPYRLTQSEKHKFTKLHLSKKLKPLQSLPIEAITRSSVCTHEI